METRQQCINAFVGRWNGTQYQTGGTRKVGIKKDVHVAAYYLHPAMVPVDGVGRMMVEAGDRAAVGRVFARFFAPDEDGQAKRSPFSKSLISTLLEKDNGLSLSVMPAWKPTFSSKRCTEILVWSLRSALSSKRFIG